MADMNSDSDTEEHLFACRFCPGRLFTAAEKETHRDYHKRVGRVRVPLRRGGGRNILPTIRSSSPSPEPVLAVATVVSGRGNGSRGGAARVVPAGPASSRRRTTEATTTSGQEGGNQPQNETTRTQRTGNEPTPGPSSKVRVIINPPSSAPPRPPAGQALVRDGNNANSITLSVARTDSMTDIVRRNIEPLNARSSETAQDTNLPAPSTSAQARVQNDEPAGPSTSNPANVQAEPRTGSERPAASASGSRPQNRRRTRFKVSWEKIISYKCPYCPGKLFRADEREAHDREHFPVHYGAGSNSAEAGQQPRREVYTCVRCPGLAFTRIEKKMHKRHHKLGQRLASQISRRGRGGRTN